MKKSEPIIGQLWSLKWVKLKGLYQYERWKFGWFSEIFWKKSTELNVSAKNEHIWLYLTDIT